MKNGNHMRHWVLASGLVGALCVAPGLAQARDVVWSVGVGAPGVQVGLTNAPAVVYQQPVYVQPRPVYWQRPAVILQPQPVYYAAPQQVYYAQPQVIVAPPPQYRGWGPHRHGRWDNHHRGFDGDRGGRDYR